MRRPPPRSTLFPYTTLFRSEHTSELQSRRDSYAVFCLTGVQTCADRKSTRLNSSHVEISYAVFCLKKNVINVSKEREVSSAVDGVIVQQNDFSLEEAGKAQGLIFFNDTATTEIYTLSLHDALPI